MKTLTYIIMLALGTSCVFAAETNPASRPPMNYKNAQWSNGKGTIGGREALLRRNESLLTVEHGKYPYTLLVTLNFKNVAKSGIPIDGAELTRADKTEEAIADALFQKFGGLFALSITTNGNRDLFIMLDKPVDESLIEKAIQSVNPQIDYSLDFMEDPKWQPYFRFFK